MLKIIGGLLVVRRASPGADRDKKKPVPKDRLFYMQCVCRS